MATQSRDERRQVRDINNYYYFRWRAVITFASLRQSESNR